MPDQNVSPDRSKPRSKTEGSWKFTEAKAQLSKVVQRALEGEPQRIVRGGRETVVVVAEVQYDRMAAPRRGLVDLFSALRGSGVVFERDRDLGRDIEL